MKYAQFIIGLLAGTALGGSVVASTGVSGGALSDASVKQVVRDVIRNEPELLVESLQSYQQKAQEKQLQNANEVLKDASVREQVLNDPNAASAGPKDSKRVLVEFFDYNCGACKMMFKSIDEVMKKDPSFRVIFHEFPIFGPVSDTNSKIGIAVNRLYPEKYFEFHTKMLTHDGRVDEKVALGYAKELGMDADKIKAESAKPDVAEILVENRKLGEKLHIQGTPTLVIGDEIIPHGISPEELTQRLDAAAGGTSAKKE